MRNLFITSLLLIVLTLSGCFQSPEPMPKQDIPSYTADRVIYVANANSPTCWGKANPSWQASYLGNGRWLVTKQCMLNDLPMLSPKQWYFYEATGQLVKK